jgi:energy-coupling factor transporter ATP-binding protein EcfA2
MPPRRNRPLRPLRNLGTDEARYLNIDSSHLRYEEFKAEFDQSCAWGDQGHLVVVTGERGYGKSSLIQRCAYWLKSVAEGQGALRVAVADLSDERWPKGEEEPDRLKMTLSEMLDALGDNIEADERRQIDRSSELWEKFRDLGRILAATRRPEAGKPPLVLVVLTQGYPKPAEIEQYYRFARPGMFFFAELWERDHISDVRRLIGEFDRDEVTVRELPLDVLRPGDAERIVQAIRNENGSVPEVTPPMVAKMDENIIAAATGVGMRQFSLLIAGVLEIAAAKGAVEVTDDHLIQYFSRHWRDHGPQPDE